MARRANAHDLYFKSSLTQPGMAADFVRHYLPPEVAATLDLDSLTLLDGSFVDERLRGQQSDLLFSVKLRAGGEAVVYLLFEHKSAPDRLTPMQLLRYCMRKWERDLRESPAAALRPIIPVLVYHGRRRWTGPINFSELFDGPQELRRYRPDFAITLLDLGARPENTIIGSVPLRVTLLMLRAIFRPDLPERLPRIASLLRQLADRALAQALLYRLLSYVTQVSEAVTAEDVQRVALAAEPEEGEEVMPTLAQQWIAEGRKEGRAEGLDQGLSQGTHAGLLIGIEVALDLKFGPAGLALLPEIHRIEDLALLQRLLTGIRNAAGIDELRAVYRV